MVPPQCVALAPARHFTRKRDRAGGGAGFVSALLCTPAPRSPHGHPQSSRLPLLSVSPVSIPCRRPLSSALSGTRTRFVGLAPSASIWLLLSCLLPRVSERARSLALQPLGSKRLCLIGSSHVLPVLLFRSFSALSLALFQSLTPLFIAPGMFPDPFLGAHCSLISAGLFPRFLGGKPDIEPG